MFGLVKKPNKSPDFNTVLGIEDASARERAIAQAALTFAQPDLDENQPGAMFYDVLEDFIHQRRRPEWYLTDAQKEFLPQAETFVKSIAPRLDAEFDMRRTGPAYPTIEARHDLRSLDCLVRAAVLNSLAEAQNG